MKQQHLIILIVLLAAFSCSDKEDEEPNNSDPLIGMWQMVALKQNGQTVDITDQTCLKDSQMNVSETTMTLTLSAPKQQGGADCQTESSSVGWTNEDGTYYTVEDGEKKTAIFLLAPDQSLHVDITLDGNPLTLVFNK
jgi:hypothetical protein